jgi:hypothetical protein
MPKASGEPEHAFIKTVVIQNLLILSVLPVAACLLINLTNLTNKVRTKLVQKMTFKQPQRQRDYLNK